MKIMCKQICYSFSGRALMNKLWFVISWNKNALAIQMNYKKSSIKLKILELKKQDKYLLCETDAKNKTNIWISDLKGKKKSEQIGVDIHYDLQWKKKFIHWLILVERRNAATTNIKLKARLLDQEKNDNFQGRSMGVTIL